MHPRPDEPTTTYLSTQFIFQPSLAELLARRRMRMVRIMVDFCHSRGLYHNRNCTDRRAEAW